MPYPDLPNPDLLLRIPSDARIVLDVGCGAGSLGAEYKRRNPGARVMGVEYDAGAAEVARRRLDAVFVYDLDVTPVPFSGEIDPGTIDCLIYGDVLEHLREPWNVLRDHLPFLSERGLIIICCPNAEHWSFAERLMRGIWAYEDQGLFDATHLRWFTAATMRRMLRTLGLSLLDVTPRIFGEAECDRFAQEVAPGLAALGIDAESYRERAAPLQYVWRASRRADVEKMTVVSTMLSPVGGVSDVRVVEPMEAMRSDPRLSAAIVISLDESPPDIEGPRVFIFHRPLLAGADGLRRVKALVEAGWVVVCEFDDHPDYIPVLQRPDVQNFRAVHAIQTTTEPLAEVLRTQNPETVIFENAVALLPDTRNFSQSDHVTLLFAGLNREGDWPPFVDAMNAVAQRLDTRLKFHVVNDRALFDSLQTRNKAFTPRCDYQTYRALLSESEISFMPLADTAFNRCKSDLKYIEAAAYGVATLASPVVYGGVIQNGQTGLIVRDADEFARHLTALGNNPDLARSIGRAGRQYIAQHRMLCYQVSRRLDWYCDLWARRDELNQALAARVPELADVIVGTGLRR